jgi:hypothetical protein
VSLNLIPVNTPHVDIASAKEKFDPQGRLVDQPSLDQLRQLLIQLENLIIRLRNCREEQTPVDGRGTGNRIECLLSASAKIRYHRRGSGF